MDDSLKTMSMSHHQKTTPLRRKEGFPGQQLIVLPRSIVSSWLADDPILDLLPSDVGYFPKAQWHYVERREGVSQLVLIYCIAGSGFAQIGDTAATIRPGQVLVIPPGMPHIYRADIDDPWSIYWLHVAGSKMDTVLRLLELEAGKFTLFPGLDPALRSFFDQVIQTLEKGYLRSSLRMVATALHQVLNLLISARSFQHGGKDHHDREIRKIVDLMSNSLDQSLTLPELARSANMSTSHFAALFKKQTGFAPIDYYVRLKMQRACYLLDVTDMPVKEIAAQLGYDDPLYFSRRFRQIHNCSPTQYQAIQKG